LPLGLSIGASSGTISGTPSTSAGSPYTVVVTATDSANFATRSYPLKINPSAIVLPTIVGISTVAGASTIVAPNTYVSIYGSDFAAAGFSTDWGKAIVNGQLPTTLGGVSVTFGGTPVYVQYVSAGQVNVLLPNLGLGPMQVVVTNGAGASTGFTTTVQQYSPGFLPWPNGQPVATHIDYSIAAGPGTFPGTNTIPAAPGETIVLWCSGFGPTTPAYPVGTAVPTTGTYVTTSNVTVSINSGPATVYNNTAALAGGYAGLYQIGVTVPTGLANGSYTITATINGATTPVATLVVHN
jgi:uncharacterized protein (TIGR03437 family)